MNIANIGNVVCLRKTVPRGWNWIKTDKRRIKKEVKGLRDSGTLAISEAINRIIDTLITQLQSIIDLSILRHKA